jgi:hypothetical protein
MDRYLEYLEEELFRCAKQVVDDFVIVVSTLINRLMYRLKTRREIMDYS